MLIFALHQFDTKEPNLPYAVSRRYLESIISTLEIDSCVPLDECNLSSPIKDTWALSVDDGYATDVKLWEFCKSLNIPLTSFVNTANLGKKGFISSSELKDLFADGMRIGTHAHNHCDLTILKRDDITSEISRSKSILENLTGAKVSMLAYPWGRNNCLVRKTAQCAGIEFAFATTARSFSDSGPKFCIPRYALTENAPILPKHFKTFSYAESLIREPIKLTHSLSRRIFDKGM